MEPDFDLADVDAMAAEVRDGGGARAAAPSSTRCRATPAATPASWPSSRGGRGVHVVAPTGLHHDRFYGPAHWSHLVGAEDLADLFVADITEGIDELDYSGPDRPADDHRAGVIKVAGSEAGRRHATGCVFEAAAVAHRRTGAPILTHCEAGTGALEQVRLLARLRRRPVARRAQPRRQGRRSRLPPRDAARPVRSSSTTSRSAGATGRTGRSSCSAGWSRTGSLDRIVLGMDAARQGYYRVYGGSPGLALAARWVQRRACEARASTRRSAHRLFVDNPARAFAFAEVDGGAHDRPLLTSVVGSHARPSWFVSGIAAAERGEFGPADLEEMLDDAVDLALRDQEEAGIDVVSDGEMRRAGFFTAEFYRHVTGVRALPAGPAAGRRRARPAAPLRGARADRRARRARRRRRVSLRAARARRGRSR